MTRTETTPFQPETSTFGNVDVHALIRLSMSGKVLEFTAHTFPISISSEIDPYSPTDTDTPPNPPPRSPGVPFFGELVGGVLFSRSFIKTYNLVLLVCLLVATAAYQADHLLALRRRRRKPLSSSAPTVACCAPSLPFGPGLSPGSSTPCSNEREPLLMGGPHAKGKKPLSPRSIYNRICGIISYQPAHILGYECPPISMCIFLVFYYALNLFYASYRIPFHSLKMFVFADRLGLVFITNLPLLYLMAAKNCPLRVLTGWSYEQLNILHRAVGRVCITAATSHFATFIWVWDKTLVCWPISTP